MSPQSSEGSESRAAQKRPLNRSLNPTTFYATTPRTSKDATPHHPSLLRNASTPGPLAATPVSPSTFSVVLGSPPLRSLASNTFETPSTTTKKRGRPFKNPPPLQSIAKKRRRPFKNPEAAAAATAAESSDHMRKKRGRPFKYPLEPEQILHVVPPEPKFIPFICEWKNCPAELHNLDTLRAHLYTVHLKKQPSSGPQVCLWKKCCQDHEVADAETGTSKFVEKGVEFETKEEWQNHVKVAHLDPIAWHQGDGPKAALDFAENTQPDSSLSYLYDEDGRQVTPLLKSQPEEAGRAKDNNAARFRKQRDGLYVVLVPIDNPEVYMKIEYDDDNDDAGDEATMDES